MIDHDNFTDIMIMACELDHSRSKNGHQRQTKFIASADPYGDAVKLMILHRKPDGETKRVAALHPLQKTALPGNSVAHAIFSTLDDAHEMLDRWAFRVPIDLSEDDDETG